MAAGNLFVRADPMLWVPRVRLANPELQPVSTGFARGRAFRAKKLRKVSLRGEDLSGHGQALPGILRDPKGT